jgi:2,4-dienoyl-CoA reductase-like NADH-dependent reductase (Old Yellow Enzyme family)
MSIELFEPFSIGKMELRNRFVRSATWDATADGSGAVTDVSLALYDTLGQGGLGLIVTGFAFVSSHGQSVPAQYGVHDDAMIPGLRRLVQAVHKGSAKIALQIAHAGINSPYLGATGAVSMAVSAIPEWGTPHREMAGEEIESIITDFVAAAVRGREAGFDAIQLHGAHGYLMSQFLSPLFNHRTDKWGGNAENRRRFHLEVIRKVRQAIGADFPLIIKFGVGDDKDGGLTLGESVDAARQMARGGIDAIEVSTGSDSFTNIMPVLKKGDPERVYYRSRAATIKRAVKVPVMVVAGMRSLEVAKDIVDSGDADLISMCRPFIREPHLVARWQAGEAEPAMCISCNGCAGIVAGGNLLKCGQENESNNPD